MQLLAQFSEKINAFKLILPRSYVQLLYEKPFSFCIFIPLQAQFKDTLFNLWFNRGNITTENPTAFQKIFVGEIVRNPYKLSVRNWIQFAMLESRRLNYYGYMHYYPYDVGFPINAFIKAHTSILLLVPIMCRNKKSACYIYIYIS